MPAKSLPSRPSLDHLKYQARDLLNACQTSNPDALIRVREFHPEFAPQGAESSPAAKFSLSDAQLVVAREYGFESWPKLKRHVQQSAAGDSPAGPAEAFITAVRHLDMEQVRRLLAKSPALVHTRVQSDASLSGAIQTAESTPQETAPSPDNRACTALHFAARHGHDELAKLLLDHGADPNATGWTGAQPCTPLELAAWEGTIGGVELLLVHGADPNRGFRHSNPGSSALYTAAEHERAEVCQLLLNHGARPDAHTAAMLGLESLVASLLDQSPASLNARDFRHRTLLDAAVSFGQTRIAELLIQRGATLSLAQAAGLGLLAQVRRFVEADPRVVNPLDGSETPLMAAARNGHVEVIRYLLEQGANVRLGQKEHTHTIEPIHVASAASVELLAQAGADLNQPYRGYTPLQRASSKGQRELARTIADHGGTKRFYLAGHLPEQLVEPLLKLGAQVNETDEQGRTALDHALENERRLAITAPAESARFAALAATLRRHGAHATVPAAVQTGHAGRVEWFLENACPDHHVRGGADHIMARNTALRLLRRHPEIALNSIHTAAVCGELAEVARILKERPAAASEKSSTPDAERGGSGGSGDVLYRQLGPKGWEPLLYLCFTRLDLPAANDNAVAIARQLLDHGADPNVYFQAGGSRYTPLVGVIGEGEEGRLPHPQRDVLARLLLERSAEPFDMQVLYNIHFNGQVLWFLKLIHEQSVKAGRQAAWNDPEWQMLGMGNYGSGARFLLQVAIDHNDLELAEWCLTHGANPNAAPPQAKNLPQGSLRDEALRRGLHEMAELLLRHGAAPGETPPPTNLQRFIAACLRRDFTQARELFAGHPELQTAPEPAPAAAAQDRVDVLQFLLELGLSLNLPDPKQGNQRPLHVAAYSDAPAAAAFLLQHGAEVDIRETNWGATPLSFAVWGQKQRSIDAIAPFSRDPWNVAFTGHVARLRELLAAEPALAKAAYPDGETPLMRLPDDDAKAVETAKLLLAHGADPAARNKKGMTAIDLARKRGLDEAASLIEMATQPMGPQPDQRRDLKDYEQVAAAMVRVFDAEDPEALQRYNQHYHRSFTRDDLRAEVWRRVRVVREASNRGHKNPFAVAEARELLAQDAGYSGWSKLTDALAAGTPPGPAHDIDAPKKRISPRRTLNPSEWDTLLGVMKEQGITTLDAHGQMTDSLLEKVARLDQVTGLDLGGSRQLTDDGLRHLARMPQLERLDLSEFPGGKLTDRGLEVLRHLPSLKVFQMCWQSAVSDAGVAHLAHCERLENVNLLGSPTGNGALQALRGKTELHRLRTGRLVTDDGLASLREIPRFKTWAGGELKYGLMSAEAGPTHLLLDGPVTDQGLAALAGLDGLFGLSFFWHVSALTPDALEPLKHLPKLGFLGCEGKLCNDTAMRHIAAIPALRMLMGQGTVASDDGFEALSRSSTLEYIWGRECPNLAGRGFRALAGLPALRGLAVSCKKVADDSLALLPRFPSLRELMPMDVPDAGFRHVGRCAQLEKLICMYCRDTTDAATEHLKHLTRLKTYYAGATQITDRSLEILSDISSLEKIEFYECKGVTDAGLPFLARLPKLREVEFGGLPNVTLAGTTVFPASVRVRHSS